MTILFSSFGESFVAFFLINDISAWYHAVRAVPDRIRAIVARTRINFVTNRSQCFSIKVIAEYIRLIHIAKFICFFGHRLISFCFDVTNMPGKCYQIVKIENSFAIACKKDVAGVMSW